jgi:hypothetical protein
MADLETKIDKLTETVSVFGQNLDALAEITQKGFERVDKRLTALEDGQEQIKLRLDNVAYRFELVELQRRVDFLEKKVGVSN